jgi:glyoxylase-like metal-dependent hydrolase (beta-lactamase superfamily II)
MGAIRPLGDGVWINEVSLREYDVRGVLVVGDAGALVWDTLSHPRDMSAYLPLIGDRPLTIVYSHADWDHVWGTAGLPHRHAAIVGHRSCAERFGADVPATLEEMRGAEPGVWDDVALISPSEVFEDSTAVDLGAITIMVHHLPGHTLDCCVAFVQERDLLLMGDTVETPFPVVPQGCPLDRWITQLERWESDSDVATVVPAHGPVGGREIIQSSIRYLQGLRNGCPAEVPHPLTEFYRATHESNLRAAGLGR